MVTNMLAYHVTKKANLESIRVQGLLPGKRRIGRSGSVYFYTAYEETDAILFRYLNAWWPGPVAVIKFKPPLPATDWLKDTIANNHWQMHSCYRIEQPISPKDIIGYELFDEHHLLVEQVTWNG